MALLAALEVAWPETADSSAMTHLTDDSDWQCVLQPLDDPPTLCLGILRPQSLSQRHDEVFFTTVETLPDIVARLDRNHRHLYINPAIEHFTGLSAQLFIGRSKREIGLPPELVAVWEPLVDKVFDTEEPAEEEHELPTVHGPRTFLTRAVPERSADGAVRTVLSTSNDITELKALQRQLAELARTDPLTSVLNQRGFAERLEAELSRVRDGRGGLSVLLLDVNDFKSVNDTFGHIAGDNVLMAIGEALQLEAGPDDFVGRLGGDEFCVALVDADAVRAAAAADRIRRRISGYRPDDGNPYAVSVSIGLATAGDSDATVADLMTRVDRLMYQEKSGRAAASSGHL
ncbi:diguanylate cyclase [Mycobacterium sp. NBC_00419]|uniref:GGDEF domain-containing protein n=1 Tax=Mycobacterium sp. NBC_00419 TaxID=2975989 RepID=UPI002E1B7925|nr:diguanylate cyclase [Mycobacterium sp. NBC_00419]